MKLHKDKYAFLNIIGMIHEASGIREDIIEKGANNGFPFDIKRSAEKNPYKPMTEEELLYKLEQSRNHAGEGKYKTADAVVSDLRLQ